VTRKKWGDTAAPAALFALNVEHVELADQVAELIAPSTQRWLGSPAGVCNRMRTNKSIPRPQQPAELRRIRNQ
jgi:hypothetical protein